MENTANELDTTEHAPIKWNAEMSTFYCKVKKENINLKLGKFVAKAIFHINFLFSLFSKIIFKPTCSLQLRQDILDTTHY